MTVDELFDFIIEMNGEIQEEKIWYTWNHLALREEEFFDFRKRVLESAKTPEKVDKTGSKGIDVSNKILGWEV